MTTTPDAAPEAQEAPAENGDKLTQPYRVRLLMKTDALSPTDAVEVLIEQLTSHGLRTWTYSVEDLESGEIFYVDGYGSVERMEDVVEALGVEVGDDDEGTNEPSE